MLVEHGNSTNMILNTTGIKLYDNAALVGNFIYMHVRSSCDELCVLNSLAVDANIMSLSPSQFGKLIMTPPSKLVLQAPAICVDDNNGTSCENYLVKNIMFGQEIILETCVLNYFNKPAVVTQFL